MCQLASLSSNSLEQVVDEGVHDGHGLGGYTRVGMHLLQHLILIEYWHLQLNQNKYLVDVDTIGFFPLGPPLLLVALGCSLGGFA